MVIFKSELRQLRLYTICWSACMAVLIFLMLPMYVNMIASGAVDLSAMGSNSLFETLGTDITILSTPIGMFGWLTSFFALAGGVNGMFLGLQAFTKETVGKSAEFLYTKPYRRGSVYGAKVAAGLVSAVITGLFYLLGAAASALLNLGGLAGRPFLLIALSLLLIEIFFVLCGAFLGTLYGKIRTPLLASAGIVFFFYILAAFADKVQAGGLKYFTPFAWFSMSGIAHKGGYSAGYTAALALFCCVFYLAGRLAFIKKDIPFIS
ncbi:MAG: ABC transporter permease [Firmicutes bacterium]|nr:ABC transporter permease [Bacillota bacterium]